MNFRQSLENIAFPDVQYTIQISRWLGFRLKHSSCHRFVLQQIVTSHLRSSFMISKTRNAKQNSFLFSVRTTPNPSSLNDSKKRLLLKPTILPKRQKELELITPGTHRLDYKRPWLSCWHTPPKKPLTNIHFLTQLILLDNSHMHSIQ